jgi:folate-dependent phosphoribosylglycinamide formyltransferase PurN
MDPLRVAVLASHSAPGLRTLLADPNRGSTWELSIVIGSETSLAESEDLELVGVPLELRPIRMVHSFRNLHAREEYEDDLGELLTRLNIEYVLLAGWQYILTPRLLARFEGRVFALHHADLSVREDRLYAGPHPVRDAILAGESETRTSVYVVTRDVARGPLFLLSGAFPVASMALDARARGNAGFLSQYADLHERWMTSEADGPMLVRTLELLAGGTTQVVHDVVWIDGAPGPCRMGEAPRACHEPAIGIPRSCPFIG